MKQCIVGMVVIIVAILLAGCSDGNPVVTSTTGDRPALSQSGQTNRHLWGFWEVSISEDRSTVEVAPARVGAMHFNVVRLLEETPCSGCLSIYNPRILPNGELSIEVTLRHPFPGMIRLTGFDVRGMLIGNSDYEFPSSGRTVAWGDDHLRLINADGYTALFNPVEFPKTSPNPPLLRYYPGRWEVGDDFSATLNPYIAFSEDQPRRLFEAGSSETRTYLLEVPSGPLEFGYAVDACWVPVSDVVDPVTDFPPEANCAEAYKIRIAAGSVLPVAGSTAPVEVEIWDHQGQSTVSSVAIEAPDLFAGEIPLEFSTDTGEESYLYEGTFPNDLGAYIGEYPLLVRVTDNQADPNLGVISSWQVGTVKVGPKAGWARTWGGEEIDIALALEVDESGNSFAAGWFQGTVDFDPGPGVEERTNDDGGCFLSKFDNEGVFLWVLTWDAMTMLHPIEDITIDGNGSLYLGGSFGGTMDFDPGPGIYEMNSGTYWSPFLLKLDNDGSFQWALYWGDYCEGPIAAAVTTDEYDNVYISGMYSAPSVPVDFDPGPGEDEHEEEDGTFFVSKFDSSGQYLWGRTWGGGENVRPYSIITGPGQTVYVAGNYDGTMDFDPGLGEDIRDGYDDGILFISKFDSNGNHQWVRTWAKGGYLPGSTPVHLYDISVDKWGNILATGEFNRRVDFDPGDGVEERIPNANGIDAFLSKFDPDGDFQWVQTWGGDRRDPGNSVATDASGNILVTGLFYESVDFDPGVGVEIRNAMGILQDCYLLKLHSDGEFEWVQTWGGIYDDPGIAVSVDNTGNAYVLGEFYETVDFDTGPYEDIHISNGRRDVFLAKYPPDGNW